jgi:HSP20 family protein
MSFAEIPGVKDDIQVTIEGNQVTIAAEVKKVGAEGRESKNGERLCAVSATTAPPIAVSCFRELDETASEAKYENGVQTEAGEKARISVKLTIQ